MKKLVLIVFLLTASFTYSQNAQMDYKAIFSRFETVLPEEVHITTYHPSTKERLKRFTLKGIEDFEFMLTGVKVSAWEVDFFFPYSKIIELNGTNDDRQMVVITLVN